MADKMTDTMRHTDAVSATFEDAQGFTARVTISREDLALLIRTMEGGTIRSRFSSAMLPDTDVITAAGTYLRIDKGYSYAAILAMSDWSRIWLAEGLGWKRPEVQRHTRSF